MNAGAMLLLLLQLYMPCTESRGRLRNTRQLSSSSRRRPRAGTRGRLRRLDAGNVFARPGGATEDEPFKEEPYSIPQLMLKAARSKSTKQPGAFLDLAPRMGSGGKGKGKGSAFFNLKGSSGGTGGSMGMGKGSSGAFLDLSRRSSSSNSMGDSIGIPLSSSSSSKWPSSKSSSSRYKGTGKPSSSSLTSPPATGSSPRPSMASSSSRSKTTSGKGKGKGSMTARPLSPTISPIRPTVLPTPTPSPSDISPSSDTSEPPIAETSPSSDTSEPPRQTAVPTMIDWSSCEVDSTGSYGLLVGDVTVYDFFFQTQVTPETTKEDMDNRILKDIEILMANALIPSLFQDRCSVERYLQEIEAMESTGQYNGITTRPADFVLSGFTCSGNFLEPCFIISGAKTVYTQGMTPEQVRQDLFINILKIIESGRIENTIPEILGMDMLDSDLNIVTLPPAPSNVTASPTTTNGTTVAPSPTMSPSGADIPVVPPTFPPKPGPAPTPQPPQFGLPLWAWIVIACSIPVLCLVIYFIIRMGRTQEVVNKEDDEEDRPMIRQQSNVSEDDDDDDDDDYTPPRSNNFEVDEDEEMEVYNGDEYSDSEKLEEGDQDFVPPDIELDPNAEGAMIEIHNPGGVFEDEEDEDQEESEEAEDGGEEDEHDEQEDEDDDDDEEEDEELDEDIEDSEFLSEFIGEIVDGDKEEKSQQSPNLFGEFQVVPSERMERTETEGDEEEEEEEVESYDEHTQEEEEQEASEQEGSEYDEQSYIEEEEYEEASYDEASYEEEVIEEESEDEEEGHDEGQSWLKELQEAQAGNYPSRRQSSL